MNRRMYLTTSLAIWGFGLACWACYINTYANTPEQILSAPTSWPAETHLKPQDQRPTLVMFLHPGCPCSRASLWELEELQAQIPQKFSTLLVMVSDEAHADSWRQTPLQKQAATLPDTTVVQDVGSLEADLFHARTSGETFLYSPEGKLLFHGGITAARGHMGEAPGQDAIATVLKNHPEKSIECNAFGCQLTQRLSQHSESRP